jgi:hypothetical protein
MASATEVTKSSDARLGVLRLLADMSFRPVLQDGWRLLWSIAVLHTGGGYRPECYYMRGPGPKCREKEIGRPSTPSERVPQVR